MSTDKLDEITARARAATRVTGVPRGSVKIDGVDVGGAMSEAQRLAADVLDLAYALGRARAQHQLDESSGTCAHCDDAGCCYKQRFPCKCRREMMLAGEMA